MITNCHTKIICIKTQHYERIEFPQTHCHTKIICIKTQPQIDYPSLVQNCHTKIICIKTQQVQGHDYIQNTVTQRSFACVLKVLNCQRTIEVYHILVAGRHSPDRVFKSHNDIVLEVDALDGTIFRAIVGKTKGENPKPKLRTFYRTNKPYESEDLD